MQACGRGTRCMPKFGETFPVKMIRMEPGCHSKVECYPMVTVIMITSVAKPL